MAKKVFAWSPVRKLMKDNGADWSLMKGSGV